MNNFCAYYCLYGNILYKQLLEISLMSLSRFLPRDSIVIFSEYEIPEWEQYCKVILTKFPEGFAISMGYRLFLGAKLLDEYEKVIHLDVDTVVTQDIADIFNVIQQGQISFETEIVDNPNKIVEEFWAGPLLTEDEKIKYKDISSICCGIFGFDKSMQHQMNKIYDFIVEIEMKGFRGVCCDQHAFTTYVLRNNLYNFTLKDHVTHSAQKFVRSNSVDLDSKFKIYHFAGGVSPNGKYDLMKKLLSMSEC